MTTYHSWQELPFPEIWAVDTEFYPGCGTANGGRDGDHITPLCLVAYEMRSGRKVRLWQDKLGRFPPYRLDADALVIGYALTAEFGVHIALGWREPARALDCYVEFRHCVNDGAVVAAERERGFYSLAGALRYFCEDSLDITRKEEMRDRIILGPPFSNTEREDILAYCEDDVIGLARLLPHIIPTIRSLPHAMLRAKFMWATAQQERRGIPLNLPALAELRARWSDIQLSVAEEKDQAYGVYEIKNGRPHWRTARFESYLARNCRGRA